MPEAQQSASADPSTFTPPLYKLPQSYADGAHAALRDEFTRCGFIGGKSDVPRRADGKFASPTSEAEPRSPASEEDSSPSPAPKPAKQPKRELEAQSEEAKPEEAHAAKSENRYERLARENKALREERARHQAELQAFREQQKKAKREQAMDAVLQQKRPDGYEDWEEDKRAAWIASQTTKAHISEDDLAEMRRVALENRVTKALRNDDLDDAQLEAVVEIVEATPTLTPREALAVAQARKPDLFIEDEPEAEASVPPSHTVIEPSQSSRSRAPAADPRKELMKQLNHRDQRVREKAAEGLFKLDLFPEARVR